MKKKYCIGFFVVLFVFVSLLGIGYQVSYQYVMDRQMARQQDKQQHHCGGQISEHRRGD